MATSARLTESLMVDTLMNYLVSMARTVESAMNRALDAIVSLDHPRTAALPGEVFLLEPRINEMEIVIDEQAIRLLRLGSLPEEELRLIVAALKLNNDLERICERQHKPMTRDPQLLPPCFQSVLATRHLERIADHATNTAEVTIFWVRGLDVRHGRGLGGLRESNVTKNSPGLDSDVAPGGHTDHLIFT